jgi:hypothetical protein
MSRRLKIARCEEWRKRLARYEKSDLTITQFCFDEGVSAASFYLWRKKLRSRRKETPTPGARFQSVEIISPAATFSERPTVIRWKSGVEIELGTNLVVVEAVIDRLLKSAGMARGDGGGSC